MRWTEYIELVWYKGLADLHADAARGYVGFIWWVLEPILYMAAFYVAFGLGIRAGGAHMLLFLLCGLVPWKWFASTVQNSGGIIQANSGLIQQVYLPKYVLPWMVLVTNGLKFLIILSLLLLFTAFSKPPTFTWIALPVIVAVEFIFVLALSSLTAALVPLLPDLDLVVSNGLIVLMFVSGVFNDVSRLSPRLAHLLQFNPMVHIIAAFRAVLLDHAWPDWTGLAAVCCGSLAVYALAALLLVRFDRAYPKLMIS